MGIRRLSEIFTGFFVIISTIKKIRAKIAAQISPTKKIHIIKLVMHPAIAPSHDLFELNFNLFLPNLIPT